MKYYYLLLDFAAISFPLLRSFEPKLHFVSKLKWLILGILFAIALYIPWDMYFTEMKIWGFNDKYLSGFFLYNLPVEEWLFFFIIPYCCFFVYEVSLYFFKLPPFKRYIPFHLFLSALLMVIGLLNSDKLYTSMTFILCSVTLTLTTFLIKQARWNHFWITYLLSLVPFLLMNGALTGAFTPEPVVWYNNQENLGIRLITIPLEDTVYLLCYLLLIFSVYERKSISAQMAKLIQ